MKIRIKRGVRQGDTISPKLFTATLESIFRRLNWENKGVKIDGEFLSNLRLADDILLCTEQKHHKNYNRWYKNYPMKVGECVLKPATGRPYVRAFSLSGTVPAFTCDCLRFVCAFTPRSKVDLCVSTYSRTMLAFGNNVSFSSSACSTLASCRR